MNKRVNEQLNKRVNEQLNKRVNEEDDECTKRDVWVRGSRELNKIVAILLA